MTQHARLRSTTATLSLWLAACGATPPPAATAPPTAPPVERPAPPPEMPPSVASETFLDDYAKTQGFRLGQPTGIRVTPDGGTVLFLRSGAREMVRDLYAFDVASGEERVLLTAERLLGGEEEELSPEERARRERLRMTARGIAGYELSKDGARILVPLSGGLFVVERESGAVVELPDAGGYANEARLSPDASRVACVREGDLYVVDVARGTQRRITTTASETIQNGIPEFVAQEEMGRFAGYWWSPDSRTLLYQETDTEGVERLYAGDPTHPEVAPQGSPYPRAGRQNAAVRLGLVAATGGRTRWITWDAAAFPYVATVRWHASGLHVLVQNRAQTEERLLRVDPRTGATEAVLTETDEAWLNLDQDVPAFVGDDGAFLWSTEREGAFQLELRGPDGALRHAVTAPGLGYRGLAHQGGGVAWIVGGDEPTETHVFRVPLEEGGAPERVSTEPGQHQAIFGTNDDVWVHVSNTVAEGQRWTVRRGTEAVGELRSVAEEPPFVPNAEYVTVGERDFRAVVYRPRNFVADVHYPVILSVYAGPGFPKVTKSRFGGVRDQWLADHGFVVVSLDGRGTPNRGRAWERVIRGNLVDVALEDQIAGLAALGQRFPELDLRRVGVTGWSFGGYFSAMATMRRPDIFRAGVAGAPVCEWEDYDTHYTERFMGLPAENAEGYRRSNVLTYVEELQRPLMIIHGTADDNVYFTHALEMSSALLRAGKPHQLVVLAGSTHMVADPQVARSLQAQIVAFFQDAFAE